MRTTAEVAVPSAAQNLRTETIDHQNIRVTWETPLETNGPITDYRYVIQPSPLIKRNFCSEELLFEGRSASL